MCVCVCLCVNSTSCQFVISFMFIFTLSWETEMKLHVYLCFHTVWNLPVDVESIRTRITFINYHIWWCNRHRVIKTFVLFCFVVFFSINLYPPTPLLCTNALAVRTFVLICWMLYFSTNKQFIILNIDIQ